MPFRLLSRDFWSTEVWTRARVRGTRTAHRVRAAGPWASPATRQLSRKWVHVPTNPRTAVCAPAPQCPQPREAASAGLGGLRAARENGRGWACRLARACPGPAGPGSLGAGRGSARGPCGGLTPAVSPRRSHRGAARCGRARGSARVPSGAAAALRFLPQPAEGGGQGRGLGRRARRSRERSRVLPARERITRPRASRGGTPRPPPREGAGPWLRGRGGRDTELLNFLFYPSVTPGSGNDGTSVLSGHTLLHGTRGPWPWLNLCLAPAWLCSLTALLLTITSTATPSGYLHDPHNHAKLTTEQLRRK